MPATDPAEKFDTLALTRRPGEQVCIGDIANPLGYVRVVSVSGEKTKLAFVFPRSTPINRQELADAKRAGPKQAGPKPRPDRLPAW